MNKNVDCKSTKAISGLDTRSPSIFIFYHVEPKSLLKQRAIAFINSLLYVQRWKRDTGSLRHDKHRPSSHVHTHQFLCLEMSFTWFVPTTHSDLSQSVVEGTTQITENQRQVLGKYIGSWILQEENKKYLTIFSSIKAGNQNK